MGEDQRTYSRVEARLKAMGRRVDSPDALGLFRSSGRRNNALAGQLAAGNLPKEFVDFLLELDSKVDQLLAAGRHESLRQNFPLDLEVYDISGAGIRFKSPESFAPDEPLEVVITLNDFPLRLAGAVGRVKGKPDGDLWGFEFTSIRECDLESIVQFVFQEQRELIRNRKWT